MSKPSQATYVLGHSETEMKRLLLQAAMLRPITENILRDAGIGPGMRVLDIGCGAGDVSMLVAELVGPSGSVIGIDRSQAAIALAMKRAQAAGLSQVIFKDVALSAFADPHPFDAVIGRYVIIHHTDPVEFLRTAARFLKPGGVIAFHEVDIAGSFSSQPPVWRWDAAGTLIAAALREALPHYAAANRQIEHFTNAGLPVPSLRREILIGGGRGSPLYAWLAETMRSVWPRLVEMGIVTGEVQVEALEAKVKSAVIEARSQIEGPPQVCAWARI